LNWTGLKKNLNNSVNELRQWIEPKNRRISIFRQCRLLGISRATAYRPEHSETEENLLLMNFIDQIFTEYPFFGSRQMCLYLRSLGYPVNRKRIQRLMQIMGLEAIYPKRHMSQPDKEHRIFPYLLRNTAIVRPDQVWSTDITYLRLNDGFAYLVAYMDWFSRFVLSFEVSTTLDHQFCIAALESAMKYGKAEIHNTDQGSQFTCQAFIGMVQQAGMKISMDGKGRALDNVFVERLWRTVKYEDIYLKDYRAPREAAYGLKDYFRFYNYQRPHQSLGGKTPATVYLGKLLM
jgi:putative transposase